MRKIRDTFIKMERKRAEGGEDIQETKRVREVFERMFYDLEKLLRMLRMS